MPFDVFKYPRGISECLRIIILAEEPQTTRAILIDQGIHPFHQFVLILRHGWSLARFDFGHKRMPVQRRVRLGL
jgi:hypothetical protein